MCGDWRVRPTKEVFNAHKVVSTWMVNLPMHYAIGWTTKFQTRRRKRVFTVYTKRKRKKTHGLFKRAFRDLFNMYVGLQRPETTRSCHISDGMESYFILLSCQPFAKLQRCAIQRSTRDDLAKKNCDQFFRFFKFNNVIVAKQFSSINLRTIDI